MVAQCVYVYVCVCVCLSISLSLYPHRHLWLSEVGSTYDTYSQIISKRPGQVLAHGSVGPWAASLQLHSLRLLWVSFVSWEIWVRLYPHRDAQCREVCFFCHNNCLSSGWMVPPHWHLHDLGASVSLLCLLLFHTASLHMLHDGYGFRYHVEKMTLIKEEKEYLPWIFNLGWNDSLAKGSPPCAAFASFTASQDAWETAFCPHHLCICHPI